MKQRTRRSRQRKPVLAPGRLDPTRSLSLRRAFARELRQRFARLRRAIVDLVITSDAFGLRPNVHDPFALNTRWSLTDLRGKIAAFGSWLAEQVQVLFTGPSEEQRWAHYLEAGYRKGTARAYADVRKSPRETGVTLHVTDSKIAGFHAGAKYQFERRAVMDASRQTLPLLTERAMNDLRGVTADMSLRLSRALTDDLEQGRTPRALAASLLGQVDKAQDRADLVVQGELVRAHATGQLDALEQLGVAEVDLQAEWVFHDDACIRCSSMQGVVFSLAEARGLIPAHPRCRCVWRVARPTTPLTRNVRRSGQPARVENVAAVDALAAFSRFLATDGAQGTETDV